MKKAKIMLTAIAVFAVVGGALAFKAKKFGQTVYCTTLASGFCNVAKPNFTITTTTLNTAISRCTVAPVDAPCPTTRILAAP